MNEFSYYNSRGVSLSWGMPLDAEIIKQLDSENIIKIGKIDSKISPPKLGNTDYSDFIRKAILCSSSQK